MKKTVAVLVILVTVTVFFCSNVFASTATTGTFKEASYTSNSVTVHISAQELLPYDGSFSATTGSANYSSWNMVLTVTVKNTTSVNKYISGINVNVDLTVPSTPNSPVSFGTITDIENFTDELYLTRDVSNQAGLTLVPSADFAYSDGFVLPANTTMRAICVLSFPVLISGTTVTRASLNNVTFGWSTVNNTDVDKNGTISDILSTLNSLNTYLQTNISGIRGDLYVISSSLSDVVIAEQNIYSYLTGNNGIPGIRSDLYVISSDVSNIYNYLVSNGNSNTNTTVSSDSNTLKSQSDTVHNQETQWFQQNSQAIAATGLSNYSLGINGNGVQKVSNDFTAVFNALSGWNSVYIFSLTLGLALTIIRHTPNAISRLRKRKNTSD